MKIFKKLAVLGLLAFLFVPNFSSASVENAPIPNNQDVFVFGDLNSKIQVVTYLDFESPFARRFNNTVNDLLNYYDEDDISYVYRYYPLTEIHGNAMLGVKALECLLDLGNKRNKIEYFNLISDVFEGSNISSSIYTIADNVGVDKDDFVSCIDEDHFRNKINSKINSYENYVRSENQFGIPHTVIYMNGGMVDTIGGAVPISTIRESLNSLLEKESNLNISVSPDEVDEGNEITVRFNDLGADFYVLSASCKDNVSVAGKGSSDICTRGLKIYPTGKDVISVDNLYPVSKNNSTSFVLNVSAISGNKQISQDEKIVRIIGEKSEKVDEKIETENKIEDNIDLTPSEITQLIEIIFGRDSDVYMFIQMLIQVGVIE